MATNQRASKTDNQTHHIKAIHHLFIHYDAPNRETTVPRSSVSSVPTFGDIRALTWTLFVLSVAVELTMVVFC